LRGNQINFKTSLSFEQIITFYCRAFAQQGVFERKSLTNLSHEFISLVFEGLSEDRIIVLQGVDLAYSSNQDLRNVNLRTEKDPWKIDDYSEKPIITQNKHTTRTEEAPQKINDHLEKPIMVQDKQTKNYIVYVDDNFHHMDESERYKLGEFKNCEEAVAACKKIVDEFLERGYEKGISFKELYEGYTMFGEDPFIVSDDERCRFSAWDYAKKRCRELCGKE